MTAHQNQIILGFYSLVSVAQQSTNEFLRKSSIFCSTLNRLSKTFLFVGKLYRL